MKNKYEYKTITINKILEKEVKETYLRQGWTLVEPKLKTIIKLLKKSITLLFATPTQVYFYEIRDYDDLEDTIELKFKKKCRITK